MTVSVCVLRALCVLAACTYVHASLDDVVDIFHLGKEIGENVLKSWEIFDERLNLSGGVDLPFVRGRERLMQSRLNLMWRAIDRMEQALDITQKSVSKVLEGSVGRGTRLELKLNDMSDLLNRIGAAERQMREYMTYMSELERSTLENFAQWCVSHDPGGLPGLLARVDALVFPPQKALLEKGLLELTTENFQDDQAELCQLEVSPHQLIYDMYNTIALTEIKGYAMMQFSWMLLKLYGKGNYSQEALMTRNKYHERTLRTAVAASAALRMARRDVSRCEPAHHKKGETYEEVTRFLQGYIENEVDLNSDGTCRESCADYTLAKRHDCFDPNGICTKQAACNGRVINCQYIDSDMTVCPASRDSSRRYEFVVYENGRALGKSAHDRCKLGNYKVDSWWRWLFWHCSYCMCLCDEPGPESDRYFSLWDATSDVKNNKVVTGVRIVKHGQVFHLQVSEGGLGERGFVTPGEWVPVQKFNVYDPGMRNGVDYHMLTYEKRAIDLDELDSPAGRVLTGIRFRLIGSHLNFEIRSTPFNYTTGRLSPERSEWIGNDNTDVGDMGRSKLELHQPDIPTRGSNNLRVDSQHDQYLEFTNSDMDADAAQSTVPFIDIQPLQPTKGAALLSGAGVVHHGAPLSGGFLALKVLSYDQSSHVHAAPPPPDDDEPPLPQGDN